MDEVDEVDEEPIMLGSTEPVPEPVIPETLTEFLRNLPLSEEAGVIELPPYEKILFYQNEPAPPAGFPT